MREYSQFQASFWTGETGRKLSGNVDAQLLAAYLITCRHSNQIGLYYLPLVYASHELGMGIDRVSAALRAVSDARFATYDFDSEHVWVFKMAPKQVNRSPKAIAGAAKELRMAADTPLKRAFISAYGAAFERLHSDTVSIPYPESASEQNRARTRTEQEQNKLSLAGARVEPELDRVAADLQPDNQQQPLRLVEPPIGENPAAPEPEPGEPEKPASFDAQAQHNAFVAAYLGAQGTHPSMGGKHVGSFHAAVVATAKHQQRDPHALFTATLKRWLDRGLDRKSQQFPYACFCAAWGELTSLQPPKAAAPPARGARPQMAPATTDADFADAEPFELQLARIRGGT